jgi:hypothetical protein
MRDEQQRFLMLMRRLPARLDVEQAAWVLGCQKHDVPALIAARLLKPLGNPAPNGIKFFATMEILELMEDRTWLAKMTNTITQHWFKKNAQRKSDCVATRRKGAAGLDSIAPVSNN